MSGRLARQRLVPVVALILATALAACSGSSDAPRTATASTSTTAPAKLSAGGQKAWRAVDADPCRLLPASAAAKALGVDRVLPEKASVDRTCRYGVDDTRTVEVQLFQPQATTRWINRSAGTTAVPGSPQRELALVGPGVGVLVRKGRALALVSVRITATVWTYDPKVQADTFALADAVRPRLPAAPGPGPSLARRDICDLAPASLVGKGTVALDATDPDACRYQGRDGTTVVVRWTAVPKKGSTTTAVAPVLSKPWKALGKGATWQSSAAGTSASGLGQVPIGNQMLVISTSSATRSVGALQSLSGSIARSVRAAR